MRPANVGALPTLALTMLLKHGDQPDVLHTGGPPQATARGEAGKNGSGAVYLAVALAALEISLVDHTPEEVMLVTAAGMELDCGASVGPDGSFLSLRAAIAALQIDDQLAASRFPVVLCQAAADADAAGAAQPLLQACVVCRPGGARHQVSTALGASIRLLCLT